MHKGPKPAGQPRSLRTIVESKNSPGGFPPPVEGPDVTYPGTYRDGAEGARIGPGAGRSGLGKADPKPFGGLK
jgi:hypothetical protein